MNSNLRSISLAAACICSLIWVAPPLASPAPAGAGGSGVVTIAELPFAITQCGVYVVAACLRGAPDQHGITIDANDVTLDLGGNTLHGTGTAGTGVRVIGAHSGITVRNGTLRGWAGSGLNANSATDTRFTNLSFVGNAGAGLRAGDAAMIARCHAAENGGDGLTAGRGSHVDNCVVRANGSDGIDVGRGSTVSGCTVRDGLGHGINASGGEAHVVGNLVSGNAGAGIVVPFGMSGCRIEDNHSTSNMIGFDIIGPGNLVLRNSTTQNTGNDYIIFGGNAYGRIVDVTGAGSFTSTEPWQNFTY